jgi:hypothetical protein
MTDNINNSIRMRDRLLLANALTLICMGPKFRLISLLISFQVIRQVAEFLLSADFRQQQQHTLMSRYRLLGLLLLNRRILPSWRHLSSNASNIATRQKPNAASGRRRRRTRRKWGSSQAPCRVSCPQHRPAPCV